MDDREQQIREAARALVDDVAKKHKVIKLEDFRCPLMRRVAEVGGFTPWAGCYEAKVGDTFRYNGENPFWNGRLLTVSSITPYDKFIMSVKDTNGYEEWFCVTDLRRDVWGAVPAKRKPYIKNCQWIAEVGDKFVSRVNTPPLRGEVKVLSRRERADGDGYAYMLVDNYGKSAPFALTEHCWTPVEDNQ